MSDLNNTDVCEDCFGGSASLLVVVPVLLSVIWVVFQLLHSSWVLALLITKVANLFLQESGIYIGSIHIDLLAGRLIVKHFHYYCRDYSFRVNNGYASMHWYSRSCGECCNGNTTKRTAFVFVELNGCEYHWYNRSGAYDCYGSSKSPYGTETALETEESGFWRWWKETQPSLHFTINKGRILMGNHHVERSLAIYFAKAEIHYSTNEASTPYDELLHSVDWTGTSINIVLEKSHAYSRAESEKPPLMCKEISDAYPLLKSDSANVVFSQDSPGLVPLGPTPPPKYAFDVILGSNTIINYGCYVSRQRKKLYSFFFPADHTEEAVSDQPQPGEKRSHTMFDISVRLSSAAEFNIPFAFQGTLQQLSMCLGTGSSLSFHVPWVTEQFGSISEVEGEFLELSVKSTLPYQPLGSCETLAFEVILQFPRVWNGLQKWDMNFSGRKVQVNIMFAYIDFLNALLDDWVGEEPNDLLDFVPINWTINVNLTQYEIFLFTNQYNWVDLDNGGIENTRLAFCGSTGQITLDLPFTEFIPLKQLVHFTAKGQDLVIRHYAPPSNAARESLFALSASNRYRWRIMDPPTPPPPSELGKKLKKKTHSLYTDFSSPGPQPVSSSLTSTHQSDSEEEQVHLITEQHVISAPIIEGASPVLPEATLSVGEKGPTVTPQPKSASPEALNMEGMLEDKECFPMGSRDGTVYENGWLDIACGPSITIDIKYSGHHHDPQCGEHTPLLPSVLSVGIDAPVVLIRVFGCLVRDLLALKENYPGIYINMTPFNSNVPSAPFPEGPPPTTLKEASPPPLCDGPHHPKERTIDILVNFKLQNITAEFPADLAKGYPKGFPLPSLCTDELSIKVDYTAADTKVWLHVDPISVHIPSMNTRPSAATPYEMGHVVINSIDFNCHGLTEYMCEERVEYAWMMKLVLGRITGVLSSMQLLLALDWFFTTFIHISSQGDELQVAPNGELIQPKAEPVSEDIKYSLFSLDIAEADVHICEGDGIVRLQSCGLDLEMCTLHLEDETLGLSFQLHSLTVSGFLPDPLEPTLQLQFGMLDVGNIQGDLALREPMECVPERQLQFLRKADVRTQRLWFIWNDSQCGCSGGCIFLEDRIIKRPLTDRSESAVYRPQFSALTTIPRHLGMQALMHQTHQLSNIKELHCLQHLHKGLLDHYQSRYCGSKPSPQSVLTNVDIDTRSSSKFSTSDIFLSPHSSLTSLLAEEFISMENVNIESVEKSESHKTRHNKKPNNLNVQWNATGFDEDNDGDGIHSAYHNLVNSQFLHSVTLKIPFCAHHRETSQPSSPPNPTIPRIHHRQSASDTSYMLNQPPILPSSDYLQFYIPCLNQKSLGSMPVISHKDDPLERKRKVNISLVPEQTEECVTKLPAKLSLSISVNSGNTLIVSPPLLKLIGSIAKSIEEFFEGRSAISILNWSSYIASSSVTDSLKCLSLNQSLQPVHETPPILYLHVNMAPTAFIALQFLQLSPPGKKLQQQTILSKLTSITPRNSLLTLYMSGLTCDTLLQTSSVREDENTKVKGEQKRKVTVSSVKISTKIMCPVMEFDLSALVGAEEYSSNLPGFVPAQKQLHFNMTLPSDGNSFVSCDLFEAGIKDVSVSLAASIVQSELSEDAVFTWEGMQSAASRNNLISDQHTRTNQLTVTLSFPVIWSEFAAPQCGLPQTSTSGMDLFIFHDLITAWQTPIQDLKEAATAIFRAKSYRDKDVLLTLLSNAAKCYSIGKAFNPVLSKLSVQYRDSVLFSCLHQIWSSLSVFSEIHVPCLDGTERNTLLVAVMLALASRLYSWKGKNTVDQAVPPNSPPILPSKDTDQCSEVTVGYVSISPSPSDMAQLNRQYSSPLCLDYDEIDNAVFSQVDYNVLALLKETLIPFFSAAGVELEQSPHFNTAKFSIDFTLQLREVTIFILDHLQGDTASPYHTHSGVISSPALLAEQFVIYGSLKHNSELEAGKAVSRVPLLPVTSGSSVQSPPAKIGILSNCSVSVGAIHAIITVPLLKLVKHVSMTGEVRRKNAKLKAMDEMTTPQLPPSAPPPTKETGGIAKFASSVVDQLTVLVRKEVPSAITHNNTPLSTSNSAANMRLMEYAESPTLPKISSAAEGNLQSSCNIVPLVHTESKTNGSLRHLLRQSSDSLNSVSSHDLNAHSVAITMEDVTEGTSPEDILSTMDTCGEDTTDSQRVFSSDNEGQTSPSPKKKSHNSLLDPSHQSESNHTHSIVKAGLSLPETDLLFSIFALLKVNTIKCELQVETTKTVLELVGISASVDTRNIAPVHSNTSNNNLLLLSEILPTYLSVAATLRQILVRVSDKGLPESDLLQLVVHPLYVSVGISNCVPIIPTYRCLLKLASLHVDMKQSVVKIHKRFHQLMPAFTKIYHDICGDRKAEVLEESDYSTSEQVLNMDSVIKFSSKIPQGIIHFSLDKTTVNVFPLPSLNVTYTVSPVSIKTQTSQLMNFQLVIGEHLLRFNPKEQYTDELSLRSLTLPRLLLQGQFKRKKKKIQVTLDLSVKQMNIDLTTDVLNQLLIVQNTFIKELNDLVQLLTSIGESFPHRDRVTSGSISSIGQESMNVEGLNWITLLQSCRVSLAGIVITISTPLATAIRFSTGKIEMTLANTSSQHWPWKTLPASAKNQLSLDGRVEIDINLALGYLQDVGPDIVDDLCELAYFRTRISVRNSLQNLPGTSEIEGEGATAVDTFLISILSPHLYLQSSAVEQAILFWLNCKSVYSYWQNERKLLNVEVKKATEAFIEKMHQPTHFQTPSIDFTKPRLVQITVTDVGACMPIIHMSPSHDNTQKPFPALVVTIKEMQFLLNLSHKVASTGRFQTFCIRYAEQFSLRHKIWTLDPKKHKLANYGTITRGTFRLCVATKKRTSGKESNVIVGERLLCAFQWDMSGIEVHSNTDIGHHTSTLVKTMTTISSDTDGQEKVKTSVRNTSNLQSPKSQSTRFIRKTASTSKTKQRRSLSLYHPSQVDANTLEQELARQTRKVQRLKGTGATGDSLQTEEAKLKFTEQELRTVQRIFRHPLHRFSQIFNPVSMNSPTDRGPSVRRRLSRLFSLSEINTKDITVNKSISSSGSSAVSHSTGDTSKSISTSNLGHRRYKSDLSGMKEISSVALPITEEEDVFQPSIDGPKPASHESFKLPSIDIEFDVTVNVDHGKIVLRTEESPLEQQLTRKALISHSSFSSRRASNEHKHAVESVLLIPALTAKAHYQSIVGQSYSSSPYSPSKQSSFPVQPSSTASQQQQHPDPLPSLPVKKGILSLSAVIESLPEDVKLSHSLLEFIEQVAKPTLAATAVSSSSSTESLTDNVEGNDANAPSPISFPVEVTLTFHIQPSKVYLTCQPHSQVECIIQSPDVNFVISFSLFSQQLLDGASLETSSPTASTTGPNSKIVPFNNLYVTGCLKTFALQLYSPQVSSLKPGGSVIENKEALSLTLGQALLHLSRKSVLAPVLHKSASSVDDYHTHNKLQVSVITNVASLVLGYDMRRLNDITVFRRCWYRTSLVEAIFIGSKKPPEEDVTTTIPQDSESGDEGGTSSTVINLDETVSAAIVVAASIDDFRISANFAQVMGNANLLVTHLRLEAHCDVSYNELVLLQLEGSLEKGEFDARSGVIAGRILMEDVAVHVLTKSHRGRIPEHRVKGSISLVEGRVDYMSTCILLTIATQLNVQINDTWEGLHLDSQQENKGELASICMEAHFSWEQLQLAIHRSTTKSFFNIVEKMQEFIMQQKRRSERTLSNMLPAGSAVSKALQAYRLKEQHDKESIVPATKKEDTRHHWLWAVKVGSIELMHILGIQPPKDAQHEVSLGGSINMSGKSVCIACFHGTSFRETERVVFSITEVQSSFSTQAIPGLRRWTSEAGSHPSKSHIRTCQQIVDLHLGNEADGKITKLATIHRVSTGRSRVPNIPDNNGIRDWLAYACIDTFLHEEKYVSDSSTLVRLSRKLTVQPVLLVPAFNVNLRNDHFWPLVDGVVPRVECTLTSSFTEGISVTTTVDHYLFLHEVIKGYVDYLEKHMTKPTIEPEDSIVHPPASISPHRQFECVYWKLDPHLVLMSAVSGQFNPHIKWLLEKLGFANAETTIPKWIQRGAMDPLDKVVATTVEVLVKLTATKKKHLLIQVSPDRFQTIL